MSATSGDVFDDALEEVRDAVAPTLDALERVLIANVPAGWGQRRALALVGQIRTELGAADLEPWDRDRLVEEHDRKGDR